MEYMITFRSVTPAQRAETALRKRGIDCVIRRTPRWMEENGCGYCLHMKGNSIHLMAQILSEMGISYRKVYLLRDNGITEEVGI